MNDVDVLIRFSDSAIGITGWGWFWLILFLMSRGSK